ncbi:hypothetical protein NON20_24270 (plasmid) [Synechocystis sp. B12]|nr:hypothetical protein NON20_24270 [Synechocystis sp. B12]
MAGISERRSTLMQWYRIVPTGPISISNLAPVGQNSGQVAVVGPPMAIIIAACLQLPKSCQLLGPFWHQDGALRGKVFVPLPLSVYQLVNLDSNWSGFLYRQQYNPQLKGWEVQPAHIDEEIDVVGGRYLIQDKSLRDLWQQKQLRIGSDIVSLPWQTLTLSHNRRENFEVVDEGGFLRK